MLPLCTTSTTLQELCTHPEVKQHILNELTVVGKAGKLRGFELVKAIHLGKATTAALVCCDLGKHVGMEAALVCCNLGKHVG